MVLPVDDPRIGSTIRLSICRIGNLLAVVRYVLAVSESYWRRERMEGAPG